METLTQIGIILVVLSLLLLFGVAFVYLVFSDSRRDITNDLFGDNSK